VHRKRTELLDFCEKILCQEGIETGVQIGTGRRELFEFCNLKEESTEGSSQGC
jgi:hypothetical protein